MKRHLHLDLAEIAPRTKLFTVSLGSGTGGDVMFLFLNDLSTAACTSLFGNLGALHEALYKAGVQAVNDFKQAALGVEFPTAAETPDLDAEELKTFRKGLIGNPTA